MRRSFPGFLVAAIVAAMLPACAAPYYVVLTDGTWAPAAGEPTVEGGKAMIPLRSGMVAVIDASAVDWAASKKYTQAQEQPTGPHAVPGKGLAANVVFTNAGAADGDLGSGTPQAPAPAPPAGSPGARSSPPSPPAAPASSAGEIPSLNSRISILDEQIATLNNQAGELQQQMAGQWNLDDKQVMQQKLQGIQAQISQLRSEKEELLTQLWDLQQP